MNSPSMRTRGRRSGAAGLHGELLRSRADSQIVQENWKKMEDAQEAIERSVALPPIKISDVDTTQSSD